MSPSRRLLLVSGSLRTRATTTAALRTLWSLVPRGTTAVLYEGLASLPHFNPDDDSDGEGVPIPVAELRAAIRWADAVVFSTPEYAGALPGSFKNLLDWTIGDGLPGSIYQKPVAWVNVSASGARLAHGSLRTVLGYAHAHIVEQACVSVPVGHTMVDDRGMIPDPGVRATLTFMLESLMAELDRRSEAEASHDAPAHPSPLGSAQ